MIKIRKAERTGWDAPGIRITWMDGTVHWISHDEWNNGIRELYSEAHELVFI